MQHLAGELDGLQDKAEIQGLLDELEYLMEVLDPELQDPAHDLADRLKDRLDKAR
jgi:hypothetical protein